ncbi:MAG TPA: hypothetical protein VMV94_10175 [Phycisphaerae bacterium]|nr:hypothetical protein [Phycisphaerae bacterium]
MHPSQRTFFSDMVDYAGLFPPARLSLNESVRNYARYRREPEGWMLARFVCPVDLLGELGPYIDELFSEGPPLRLAVVDRGGETDTVFLENLRRDLETVHRLQETHHSGVRVESFEMRFPSEPVDSDWRDYAESLLPDATAVFEAAGLSSVRRFYEPPLTGDYRLATQLMAHTLAVLNGAAVPAAQPGTEPDNYDERQEEAALLSGRGVGGIKLRCGGVGAGAIPSVEKVAAVIEESIRGHVPLKFTAGLHHPTRRIDPALGVYVHGFMNVLAAGILVDALELEYNDLAAIVEEEDFREFHFSEDFFGWNDAEATINEIEYARRRRVISFGSCSFEEPRDELRELGLI